MSSSASDLSAFLKQTSIRAISFSDRKIKSYIVLCCQSGCCPSWAFRAHSVSLMLLKTLQAVPIIQQRGKKRHREKEMNAGKLTDEQDRCSMKLRKNLYHDMMIATFGPVNRNMEVPFEYL